MRPNLRKLPIVKQQKTPPKRGFLSIVPAAFNGNSVVSRTGGRDVGSLRALGAILDFEFDGLAFRQSPEAGTLDGGEVDENVLSAV
jgi:hypothetical protein